MFVPPHFREDRLEVLHLWQNRTAEDRQGVIEGLRAVGDGVAGRVAEVMSAGSNEEPQG